MVKSGRARTLQRVRDRARVISRFGVAFAVTILVAACATNFGASESPTSALTPQDQPGGVDRPKKPVRIGLLLPLSGYGPQTATAKGMKQAAELALLEINDPLVQLIVKDDKGTPDGASQAARDAIGEGAEIIVGPITADAARSAAEVARRSNVPVLTFSNDRSVAGNGVYLMGVLPEQEVERIVAFSARRGKRRFAALMPNDTYGRVVEPAFRQAVQRNGGTVAAITAFPREANAMLDPVRLLASEVQQSADSVRPIDVLLVAAGPETLPQIDPILTYAGIRSDLIQMIGTGAWEFPDAGRNPSFVGGWYPGPDPHGWKDFVQRFSRSFGQTPPRLASLSYDAVSVAIALSPAEPGQRYTTAALTRPAGFTGIDGALRFRSDGVSERALAVLELQTFGGHVLEPAQPLDASVAESTAASGFRLPWQ